MSSVDAQASCFARHVALFEGVEPRFDLVDVPSDRLGREPLRQVGAAHSALVVCGQVAEVCGRWRLFVFLPVLLVAAREERAVGGVVGYARTGLGGKGGSRRGGLPPCARAASGTARLCLKQKNVTVWRVSVLQRKTQCADRASEPVQTVENLYIRVRHLR